MLEFLKDIQIKKVRLTSVVDVATYNLTAKKLSEARTNFHP
jgi:hypothetical protein